MKCDRVEPTCGWCARNDRVCVYKERKKPGLRAGYGRELETKINRLEAILGVLGRRVEDHILHHDEPNRTMTEPGRNAFSSPTVVKYSTPGQSATNDAGSQNTPTLGSRWPQGNAHERTQYSRPQDAMSVRSMVGITVPESMADSNRPSPAVPGTGFVPPAGPNEPDLPAYDLLYTLVDLYFKHVNTWSPILDRKVTFDALFGPSPPSEADRVLLHAIVATTLPFSKDPRLTPEFRRRYRDISKQKVQLFGLEHPTVRALQALVILALPSNGPPSWNLLALIARNIEQLGLGIERTMALALPTYPSVGTLQEYALPEPRSWIEDEERRRLFWMVYVLDRYATVATSFGFLLDDRQMNRQLPCRYDLFSQNQPVETRWFRWAEGPELTINRPENLGSFSYHCEVLSILTRIHKFLRRPIDIGASSDVEQWQASYRELDNELNTWLYNLPGDYGKISQLCHSDPSSKISNWIMLHAAYHTSVIRLHSAAAYPTVRSHFFRPSYNAMQRCLAAVESLREIAQDLVSTGMLDLLGPPFAFSLWVSARLLLVHGSTVERELDPNVGFFVSTLDQMGQYWEVAQKYTQILSRIVQEHEQSKHSVGGPNIAPLPAVRTFAAMRRYVMRWCI